MSLTPSPAAVAAPPPRRSFAQGILLVYDVTDRNSFNSIKTWVEEIDRNADKHVNKILIGNKCDVDDSARVRGRED